MYADFYYVSATLANRTGSLNVWNSSRNCSRTSGTTADNYVANLFTRTSTTSGAGGTMTAAGSVVKITNTATQTAGTLTDTVDVLLLDQDTDST